MTTARRPYVPPAGSRSADALVRLRVTLILRRASSGTPQALASRMASDQADAGHYGRLCPSSAVKIVTTAVWRMSQRATTPGSSVWQREVTRAGAHLFDPGELAVLNLAAPHDQGVDEHESVTGGRCAP
jgi:hypothetical protein